MNDENKIDEIIESISFAENILPQHLLKEDLGLDSLNIVELIVALEDAFDIEFEISDLDPGMLVTVQDIYDLMSKYTEENNADL